MSIIRIDRLALKALSGVGRGIGACVGALVGMRLVVVDAFASVAHRGHAPLQGFDGHTARVSESSRRVRVRRAPESMYDCSSLLEERLLIVERNALKLVSGASCLEDLMPAEDNNQLQSIYLSH